MLRRLPTHYPKWRPELREQLTIMRTIAEALQYMHVRNHIHADVKPENIPVQEDGQVILNDFGLSYDAAAPPVGWM